MSLSDRLFRLTLLAYPREFRREYGLEMVQVFRACCRQPENNGIGGRISLWSHAFVDLVLSAPREHLFRIRKENSVMNNRLGNVFALGTCLVIIVVALLLLSYGRSHEVTSILLFGRVLDALVTAGIAGNLIVFGLKFTQLNPIKTALWTMLTVHVLLLVLVLMISSRVDPTFRPGSLVVAYVVSFLFWFGLHWAWAKTNTPLTVTTD